MPFYYLKCRIKKLLNVMAAIKHHRNMSSRAGNLNHQTRLSEVVSSSQCVSLYAAIRSATTRRKSKIFYLNGAPKLSQNREAKKIYTASKTMLLAIIITYFSCLDVKTPKLAHSQLKGSCRRRNQHFKNNNQNAQ